MLTRFKSLRQVEMIKARGTLEGEVADELLIKKEAQGLTFTDGLKPDREAL
jgi:hypothetical protein